MFLPIGRLICAPQGNGNHAAYCVATSHERDRKLIGPTVADNFDFIHQIQPPQPPLVSTGLGKFS